MNFTIQVITTVGKQSSLIRLLRINSSDIFSLKAELRPNESEIDSKNANKPKKLGM